MLNGKCISLESQIEILNEKHNISVDSDSFVNCNEIEALRNEVEQLQETINLEKTTRLLIEDKFQQIL